MSEDTKKIWVFGGKASGADNSIPWQANIPNLSNSDILIVDLGTAPTNVTIPYYEIRDYLRYMMMARKTIYVLLSPTSTEDYHLSDAFPVFPNLIKIKPCDFGSTNRLNVSPIPTEIDEYCKYVENCPFFIDGMRYGYLEACLYPKVQSDVEKYPFSNQISYVREELVFEILNVSHQSIGLASRYRLLDSKSTCLHETGQIIFLPPPTKIASTDAVEVLVNSLIGTELKEDEPDWAIKLKLPRIDELERKISKENKTIEETTEKIQILTQEKNEIEKHKKLLWTNDKPLENAVKDAFILLGFGEIRGGRTKELEDWVIDFKSNKDFVHGVMEVKGSEKKTSMGDMNQCHKWVSQYRVKEEKKVLGIFLPNQFRRTENSDSRKRLQFEPNELEFAKDFKICVLPTVELFKAVVHVLKGNRLSRDEIESKILEADPICKLV